MGMDRYYRLRSRPIFNEKWPTFSESWIRQIYYIYASINSSGSLENDHIFCTIPAEFLYNFSRRDYTVFQSNTSLIIIKAILFFKKIVWYDNHNVPEPMMKGNYNINGLISYIIIAHFYNTRQKMVIVHSKME